MKTLFFNFFLLSFFLQAAAVHAQNDPKTEVRSIVSAVTKFADSRALEKIYLHTDKPSYTIGDTIWFKAYLFSAAYLTASEKSGIVYLEIANDQNMVVKRFMVSMSAGLGWGNIALNEKEFQQGNYTLRAYTNWMRNADEQYFFKKPFYISNPGEKDLLIKSRFSVKDTAGKQNVRIDLQLDKIDRQPLTTADFQLKITERNKVWYKERGQTGSEGSLAFNFDLPVKADPGKLMVTLQTLKKKLENPVYEIPLILNRPEYTDLQFMPEGGSMVEGLDTHIVFKALAENGKGIAASGAIYNSKGQAVCSFQSSHLGMGSFALCPQSGETYTAKIKLPGGTYSKPYALPPVKTSGLTLSVINKLESDSLEIDISATVDLQPVNTSYYLIGQSRGVACYGAIVRTNGKVNKIKISKEVFPTGIARFTLFNSARQALNERIVYLDQNDHLRIHIEGNKNLYTKRDSVALGITVTDKAGKPVRGSFSVAVTDDTQVKNDSLKNNSLKSAILLTSDLKGNIEDPGFYFPQVMTAKVWQYLDNLLLAQGWVNYNWATVFQPLKPELNAAEPAFFVKGKVTNIFNKPVEKAGVLLLSKKPSFFRDTVTDKAGVFNFKNIYPSDTAVYIIQTRNKRGKSSNVGIEVEEFKAPVITALKDRPIPWYVNIDSSKMEALGNSTAYKKEREKLEGGNMLKEVKIKGVKTIKGSKNLNRDGGSDFSMNQENLEKAGKVTLGDLLEKNVKGFRLGSGKHPNLYFVGFQLFHLIIDGVDIDFSRPGGGGEIGYREYVKGYLDYYTAEDIKGIEVMTSGRYTGPYAQDFLDPLDNPFDHAFVEVTTYAGAGPFLKKTPGVYLYKPVAFSSKKEFYSPKYILKNDHSFIDTRSAIYWSPNVITDKNGRAELSFYTADKPGSYTILIDGCDMNGNVESYRQKLIIE